MHNTYIHIRTNEETKKKAKKIAASLGVSLSDLINTHLKQIIRTKKITLSTDEEPSPYLKRVMRQAKKNRAEGKASPIFDNEDEFFKSLGI